MAELIDSDHAEGRKLNNIRAQIEQIDAEGRDLATRPRTVQEGMAALRVHVAQAAEESAARSNIRQAFLPGWGGLCKSLEFGDLAEWIGPDELLKRIEKHIAPEVAAEGISTADREKRAAQLVERRKKLEEDEEREVLRLEAVGHLVGRRADVDPELLLRLWA